MLHMPHDGKPLAKPCAIGGTMYPFLMDTRLRTLRPAERYNRCAGNHEGDQAIAWLSRSRKSRIQDRGYVRRENRVAEAARYSTVDIFAGKITIALGGFQWLYPTSSAPQEWVYATSNVCFKPRGFSYAIQRLIYQPPSCFHDFVILSSSCTSPRKLSPSFLSPRGPWPTTTASSRPSIMCSMFTLGPLNHLCADMNHQIVTINMGPP
jgi:hypothetical protein